MSFLESETKSASDRYSTIPEFGNRDIPDFDVNPFSHVDQAGGFEEEVQYVYHKESDVDADEDEENMDYEEKEFDRDELLMECVESIKKQRIQQDAELAALKRVLKMM